MVGSLLGEGDHVIHVATEKLLESRPCGHCAIARQASAQENKLGGVTHAEQGEFEHQLMCTAILTRTSEYIVHTSTTVLFRTTMHAYKLCSFSNFSVTQNTIKLRLTFRKTHSVSTFN